MSIAGYWICTFWHWFVLRAPPSKNRSGNRHRLHAPPGCPRPEARIAQSSPRGSAGLQTSISSNSAFPVDPPLPGPNVSPCLWRAYQRLPMPRAISFLCPANTPQASPCYCTGAEQWPLCHGVTMHFIRTGAFLPCCKIIQTSKDNAGGNAMPP